MAMLNIEEPLEVDAETLKKKIDMGEDFVLLDVRSPLEYQAWRFEYGGVRPILLPVQDLFSEPEGVLARIPQNKEVLVVCAHGNRSLVAAQMLSSLGYRAKSVRGGMNHLNAICDPAQVRLKHGALLVLQIRRIVRGCVGYVVASLESGEAVIVDPQLACYTSYIDQARKLGVKVKAIVDTHRPLDHVSGAKQLSEWLGAPAVTLGAGDQGALRLGGLRLEPVKRAAGPAPILLYGDQETPVALLSGDTLFLEGYGRPDLPEYSSIEEGIGGLFQLYEWLFTELQEDLTLLPSHALPQNIASGVPHQTTIGQLKSTLWSPKPTKAGFADLLLNHMPPKPANHQIIAQINREPNRYPLDERLLRDLESGGNNMIVRPRAQ